MTEREKAYYKAVEDGGFLPGWEGSSNSVAPLLALADSELEDLRVEVEELRHEEEIEAKHATGQCDVCDHLELEQVIEQNNAYYDEIQRLKLTIEHLSRTVETARTILDLKN